MIVIPVRTLGLDKGCEVIWMQRAVVAKPVFEITYTLLKQLFPNFFHVYAINHWGYLKSANISCGEIQQ